MPREYRRTPPIRELADRRLRDTERTTAQAREVLEERAQRITELERELHETTLHRDRLQRDLELYANADRTRQRALRERDQARAAIRAMVEQLQLTATFDTWRSHRLRVEPTDEHRNDWREHAWRALHGDSLPALGVLRRDAARPN